MKKGIQQENYTHINSNPLFKDLEKCDPAHIILTTIIIQLEGGNRKIHFRLKKGQSHLRVTFYAKERITTRITRSSTTQVISSVNASNNMSFYFVCAPSHF